MFTGASSVKYASRFQAGRVAAACGMPALDRITAPSRPVRLRNYLQRYELAPLHAVAGEAWMSLVCQERSFIRSSSMTASYIKLSLDFLTLQGNLACKEADLAGPV